MDVHGLLTTLLSGPTPDWPSEVPAERFLATATRHGVLPLVARQLRRSAPSGWPDPLLEAIRASALQQAAAERATSAETCHVLGRLAEVGVRPLVIKGAALAYTHYPYPCLRPRTDTDLLVRPEEKERAGGVLAGLGYTRANLVSGDLISSQALYTKRGHAGVPHAFDVHWKVVNPQVFLDVLTWSELDAHAVAVPALGPNARTPRPVDALLIACLHRVAHHRDSPDLIWLYDIHLLAGALDRASWDEFARAAVARRLAGACARGLEQARRCFGTSLPDAVRGLQSSDEDPSDVFLRPETSQIDWLRADLGALDHWGARVRLLREHLLPPAAYMLAHYGRFSRAWLPLLYAHRAMTGAGRWIRPASRRADRQFSRTT